MDTLLHPSYMENIFGVYRITALYRRISLFFVWILASLYLKDTSDLLECLVSSALSLQPNDKLVPYRLLPRLLYQYDSGEEQGPSDRPTCKL